jgi:hypothetical protein
MEYQDWINNFTLRNKTCFLIGGAGYFGHHFVKCAPFRSSSYVGKDGARLSKPMFVP